MLKGKVTQGLVCKTGGQALGGGGGGVGVGAAALQPLPSVPVETRSPRGSGTLALWGGLFGDRGCGSGCPVPAPA